MRIFCTGCIDPIIISSTLLSLEAGVIDISRNISDHDITYVVLDVEIPNLDTFTRHVWLYNNGDYDSMRDELNALDWEFLLNSENVDIDVQKFNNILHGLMNKYIPGKSICIRASDKPWFNSHYT